MLLAFLIMASKKDAVECPFCHGTNVTLHNRAGWSYYVCNNGACNAEWSAE